MFEAISVSCRERLYMTVASLRQASAAGAADDLWHYPR
jgi:hypothetical protein